MILIYKMLLGVLVIAVIMASLDRSVLIFIEESMPIIKQQQEQEREGFFGGLFNRKRMNAAQKKLTNNKTRIKEAPPSALATFTQAETSQLRSLEFANPKKDFAVGNYTSFCNKTDDNIDDLEKRCENLDSYSCKQVDCCVLLNGNKCVSGGPSGPNFGWKDKHGKQRPQRSGDYYYYKDKLVR